MIQLRLTATNNTSKNLSERHNMRTCRNGIINVGEMQIKTESFSDDKSDDGELPGWIVKSYLSPNLISMESGIKKSIKKTKVVKNDVLTNIIDGDKLKQVRSFCVV